MTLRRSCRLPPDGLLSVITTDANAVIIKGTADALDQSERLLKAIDVESVLPRSVRIEMSLDIVSAHGKPLVRLSTQSVGADGTAIPLYLNQPGNGGNNCMLDANITPTILPDSSISLAGSGTFNCIFANGDEGVGCLGKPFDVIVPAQPGSKVVIASGSVASGADTVSFSLSVTVTVEKGRVVYPGRRLHAASHRNFFGAS